MAKRKSAKEGRAVASEALEQLRVFGDPVLRQETRPVTCFDSRLRRLSEMMFGVMEREEGVGLAAPQIGVVSRLMVWKDPEQEDERHVFVNARILRASASCTTEPEGCLSVPGETMGVSRADEVVVEAQDLEGNHFQVELIGYQARVVQHEIDHLDGLLILDRASPEDRKRALKELRERTLAGGS
jgi:peptide deformylase